MRAELKAQTEDLLAQPRLSQQVQENLVLFLKKQQGSWASYKALRSEIEIDPAIQKVQSINWFFPKVSEEGLLFISQKAGFEKGYGGILEPKMDSNQLIPITSLQGVLVPGLGFDKKGHRLGKGKGYYDRALMNFQGIKVGVTFDKLIVESLPVEEWDIPMDILITETGIKNITGKK